MDEWLRSLAYLLFAMSTWCFDVGFDVGIGVVGVDWMLVE